MSDRIIAFPWFGGKNSKLDFILPLLPYDKAYVEPFGGSAAVLLNRKISDVEIYNDIDGNLTNWFKVIRDQADDFLALLEATPYSRNEFVECCEKLRDGILRTDKLEAARCFFVMIAQGFSGKFYKVPMPGNWGRKLSSALSWSYRIGQVDLVRKRLHNVLIDNKPALEIIERLDAPDVIMYLDPPYLPDTRKGGEYNHEMTRQDHIKLAKRLESCEAKIAVSGYPSILYNELYEGWHISQYSTFATASGNAKEYQKSNERIEVLWTNFDPKEIRVDTDIEVASLDEFL